MHRLKEIKDCLISCVQTEMHDLEEVDTHELGEVIDMIKDISEAMYYCSVVEAMYESEPKEIMRHVHAEEKQKTMSHTE
jgi:hypothetical protein